MIKSYKSIFFTAWGVLAVLSNFSTLRCQLVWQVIEDTASAFIIEMRKVFAPAIAVVCTPASVFGFQGYWLGGTPDTQV